MSVITLLYEKDFLLEDCQTFVSVFLFFSEFYLGFLIISRIKNSPQYLYMVVWNGIVYNSVTEWIKSDSNESPEEAVAKVRDALKLLSDTMSSENNKSN